MSQIKSNKVTGRTPSGTLTIGEPGSTVQFDPDAVVLINDYATKEYVDSRTPNLGDVDYDNYYNKQEIDAIVSEASNNYLQLTGGRMSGPIAMEEGNTIEMNVGDGDPGVTIHDTFIVGLDGDVTRPDQAINKEYLDAALAEAGQGDAKEYRLETDANLRSTPMIQLVDNEDMYSDVAMMAGDNIEITSAASAMNFRLADDVSISTLDAKKTTGTDPIIRAVGENNMSRFRVLPDGTVWLAGEVKGATTVSADKVVVDELQINKYVKEYVRSVEWGSSAQIFDYKICPHHFAKWQGYGAGVVILAEPESEGLSMTVTIYNASTNMPYAFSSDAAKWSGGEAPNIMGGTGNVDTYDVFTFVSTPDHGSGHVWLGFHSGKGMS